MYGADGHILSAPCSTLAWLFILNILAPFWQYV